MTTLKLEVGKSYRTRYGGKATIILDGGEKADPLRVLHHPRTGESDWYLWHTRNGKSNLSHFRDFDLISEWQDEPEKEKTRYIMDKHGNISVLGQITVRDYFAGCALQGMLAAGVNWYGPEIEKLCFNRADKMLKARGE